MCARRLRDAIHKIHSILKKPAHDLWCIVEYIPCAVYTWDGTRDCVCVSAADARFIQYGNERKMSVNQMRHALECNYVCVCVCELRAMR